MVCTDETCPVGKARARVRAIMASILCSIRQLNAAAAPDANAMPSVVANNSCHGIQAVAGLAIYMPIMAVNTISDVTRGLHSEKKLLKLSPMLCNVMAWVRIICSLLFSCISILVLRMVT